MTTVNSLSGGQTSIYIAAKEMNTGYATRTFKNGITYERIKNYRFQQELNFDDFTECDSGYCGL